MKIPHTKGAVGHSDADVLLHAICDAMLGALCLGDIGKHFPDTDPAYKGIDSKVLLRRTYNLVREKGFWLVNIDSTLLLQAPKIAPYVPEMQSTIANLLHISLDDVSIKATTTEHLSFIAVSYTHLDVYKRQHKDAPRVIIANSNLVGRWATWEHFRELEAKGLMMYGQMTAGSWIYIGSQGIVQGTYETYLSLANMHYGGTLKGTLNVTAGLGGMGGAQPLAITMNEGVCLAAEVEEWRMQKRIETRYLDKYSHNIDEAIDWALEAKANKEAVSIGVCCNVCLLYTSRCV